LFLKNEQRLVTWSNDKSGSEEIYHQILQHSSTIDELELVPYCIEKSRQLYEGILQKLLFSCYHKANTEVANIIKDKFDSLGIPLQPIHYRVLLDTHIKACNFENVFAVMSKMSKLGIEPEVCSIYDLATSLIARGRREYESRWSYLVENNSEMPTGIFNAILHVSTYIEPNRIRETFSEGTINCGVKPNLQTFNIMIEGYAIHGDVDNAVATFELIFKNSMQPDYSTYYNLVQACLNGNRFDLAEQIINSAPSPSQELYLLVLKKQARLGNDKKFKMMNYLNESSKQYFTNFVNSLDKQAFLVNEIRIRDPSVRVKYQT